jgi:hypothetical protein
MGVILLFIVFFHFTRIGDRELGLDRREPGLFHYAGYASIDWLQENGQMPGGISQRRTLNASSVNVA